MAEIKEIGYEKIRNFIEANWTYIELQDEAGTAIIRLGVNDSKVEWTHSAGASTLNMTIIISGADITLPKTVARSAIFDVASGGTALAEEAFSNTKTLTGEFDELTVTHSIQVPRVV